MRYKVWYIQFDYFLFKFFAHAVMFDVENKKLIASNEILLSIEDRVLSHSS